MLTKGIYPIFAGQILVLSDASHSRNWKRASQNSSTKKRLRIYRRWSAGDFAWSSTTRNLNTKQPCRPHRN